MFWLFLSFQAVTQALSEVPPPQGIHVANWSLTWISNPEDRELFYTVQSRSFLGTKWKDVPTCVRIAGNVCNITLTNDQADHGCIVLRVQAEKNGLASIPVESCSSGGDPCTPQFNLTARPGSLTFHLSGHQSLEQEYGAHLKQRIYVGKKGDLLKEHADVSSSYTIKDLEGEQQYCAKVQYVLYKKPGPSSCIQCEIIPLSVESQKQKMIAFGLGTLFLLVILIPGAVYLFLFHRKKIKHWMQVPCEIPNFILEPIPGDHKPMLMSSPENEEFDKFIILPENLREE